LSLRCEYQTDPLGLGVTRPRLSWLLDDDRPGAVQSAYRLLAASERSVLERNEGDLWDTGRVGSDQTAHIEYAGAPLASRSEVFWKVQTFDREGEASPWSAPATFEIGLLERTDWSAHWIGSPLHGTPRTSSLVPAVRKPFALKGRVATARLYATALGLYELQLNGERVGDHELAPGWTDYRVRVRYQVYDVSDQVKTGENVLGVLLGDGWYCGFVGLTEREQYGLSPKLLAQLEITYEDGTREAIGTDASWKWHTSALLESDLLMGETYDARQELGAWSSPRYDDSRWRPVEVFEDPGIQLVAMGSPPVRAIHELAPVGRPVERRDVHAGKRFLYDLGQNMVGKLRIRLRGEAGTTITVQHAEVLDERGELYTEILRGARQTDVYTLGGASEGEIFEPFFTFHGFRYVEISGRIEEENIEEITGVVLHSDLPVTGEFTCSDERVNQLQRNINWSQRGNFVDVPTDCPQRAERLGWTGDAQVFVRTAAFNMDVASFFTKWLTDLADSQAEDGRVPPVAPTTDGLLISRLDGGPAWADAMVICPWTIYRCYGDVRILEEHYESMVAFVEHMERRFPHGVRSDPTLDGWGGFGDWLAMDGRGVGDARFAGTPKDLIGTAFFSHSAELLSRIARILGREGDGDRFAELAARVREAFRRRFVTGEGHVAAETQTGYVLALHFDLLDGDERKTAAAALVRDIESRGNHLSTGFVGTPYLLPVLTAIDRLDVAYRLLFQTSWPSWLYPVTQGATTIWERWDGWTEEKGFQDPSMNSFNHYAYGAVGEWLYGTVAGLELDPDPSPERNAYRHALIHPRPPIGEGFEAPALLTHASARLDTIHGRYESGWRIEQGSFTLDLQVPANCSATVQLPDGRSEEVSAGVHRYAVPV
jgi:alpha-L-rhamnosidase